MLTKTAVLLLALSLCSPLYAGQRNAPGRTHSGGNRTHSGNRPEHRGGPHGRPHDRVNDRDWHDHFGCQHPFVVVWTGPYLFSNGGYAFIVDEPVPVLWAGEPVYVDYVVVTDGYEGYVLCNPTYPGVFVRLTIQ
jgi:hypothetical protein